jgi:23S rRNA (adenine2503-C2)-methyltransferase
LAEDKAELYSLTLPELEALLAAWGGTRAHTRNVWHWLYARHATDVGQMVTLPQALRERLRAETSLYVPPVLARQNDPGGETRKDLLELEDGEQVEVVLLRYRRRRSACISTQVGCACGCPFCATGQTGFVRQLSCAEIVSQVLHFQRELAARQEPGQDKWPALSNVVLMGMGEPLLNYDNTMAAVRRLIDQRAIGLPPSRVTLSTVGIVPGIERLAQENLPIKLAISLHAATDDLRDQLVPINKRYPLGDLFAAVKEYAAQTQKRVLFEWVMIGGVNDTPGQAQALIAQLAGLPAHVNLIRLNPTPDYDERPATPESIATFIAALDRAGIPHTLRQRRGAAIEAGCGQLRSRAKGA